MSGKRGALRSTMERRFWKYVQITPGCWLWTAGKNRFGYGVLNVENTPRLAPRLSWLIHEGEFDPALRVLHKCDTPACVNPDHLFLGTQADNVADMDAKGRRRNAGCKLSEEQVRELRRLGGAMSHRALAARFGVSPSNVSRILGGHAWKRVA